MSIIVFGQNYDTYDNPGLMLALLQWGAIICVISIILKTIICIIALIAIIAIIYFCANPLPKVEKRGQIPGLTGGKHSYIEQAAIAAKIL